ncbi:MAG: ComEC/Rec2 family competence protein [Candidatus Colwellbacteria bacterium]|nr:ComEC/Rec2 family competence protein [Candidatus Colwellbacteria bacterium]MBI3274294.1 ComEC/Rec2 family competence protein [Candidatus Colwellbacteria bacterium]
MRAYDIAFYVALFFILGVGSASLNLSIWYLVGISTITALFLYFDGKTAISLLIFTVFIGFFYYHFYSAFTEDKIIFGRSINFQGIVFKDPSSKLSGQEIDIELQNPYRGKVRIYTPTYPEFKYGDLLDVRGVIEKSSSGRLNIISFPKINVLDIGKGNAFKSSLFSLKRKLISNLQMVLDGEKSALMTGILFGERAEFSKDFNDALQKSGTTHIVALSGFNISIIVTTLASLLSYIWNKRQAFWATVAFIFMFVLMTGAEASAIRAGIMGVVFIIAQRASRLYSFRNAITLTAVIMIIINPKLLLFDVGFELSFLALLGIIYITPSIRKILRFAKEPGFLNWRDSLAQTFGAQLATMPVIFYVFGRITPIAAIPNLLILGLMPLTMFLGFLTSSLGFVSYHLSFITAWFTGVLLGYEIFIINLFGSGF